MVHIHSITASYHPSRQERVSDGEATSHSRAGQLHRGGGRSTTIARVDTTQHQHLISVAVAPPPMSTTEATMHAIHQLLNNPPPSGASPLATEQWCHDVDQLIITAINTPHPRGGSLATSRALVYTTPSVVGIACPIRGVPSIGSMATIGSTSANGYTCIVWIAGDDFKHHNE
jgi:hypothetical protein